VTPAGALALALARCQIQLGKADKALLTLGGVGGGALLGYEHALRGHALLETGQPIDAVQALQKALGDTRLLEPLRSQARFWLALALVQIDDLDGARTALGALLTNELGAPGRLPKPGGLDPAEVRWRLADTAVRRGTPERAVPVWQSIWTLNPTSSRSKEVEARLTAAGVPPTGSPEILLKRVKTLEKLYRFDEALRYREMLPVGHAARGSRTIAQASFKARAYARSAKLHAALPSRSSNEELRMALARLRSGDYAGAMAQYRVMAQPGKSSIELATWKLGYTAYDGGHIKEAVAQLGVYLKRYPQGKYAQRARWFRAMAALRSGDMGTARSRLTEVAQLHPKQATGATYWLGRLADLAGDKKEATDRYNSVLRRWPSTGYAWFAAHHMGRSWARRAPISPPAMPAALHGDAWTLGSTLSKGGLHAWARPHLEGLRTKAKAAGKPATLALAHALIEAGSYTSAKALARPHCGPAHRGGDPIAQQACYPRPSGKRVAALTQAAGLPESLPFAIMTAESALRPGVTSPAGARGLMQLMPKLAAKLHPQVWPSRQYSEDDLYQPAYNATLGTTELVQLSETFGSSGVQPGLPLVIAGYNGGADAVTRWVSAWPEPPPGDLFAENISYTETRHYVQRVLGVLQTYRYVYGD
jgi:soluble lytic murein transglycosylase-like protein